MPLTPLLPELLATLATHTRLVLEAPPGAGKTTRVPPALVEADWMQGRRVLVLEPRRVAARAAAAFMAADRGEAVGETVGYRIRFENRTGPRTRIEVVTEGILTRMLQDDPMLEGVGAVVFDEFHERHLAADLGLALALDVQSQLRPDLRIVVMSATLDGERLAQWLDAPRLSAQGRAFPVTTAHFPARRDEPPAAQLRRCVEQALDAHPGDLLVFLPGRREIDAALENLDAVAAARGAVLLPLHGDLPVERQSQALQPDPDGRRRVVLSTNVAESSVTLPGVRVVIDSGLAREPRFDPNSGFSRLATVTISQASADQRAGRAGRVAEGWCHRLWPASTRLEPMRRPEIVQVELAGLALELAAWGSDALRFPDPPPPGALAQARELLQRLGALAGGQITPLGRRMLALGTEPRLAAMLCGAGEGHDRALACDLAALVEARDVLRGGRRDDWPARWTALAAFRAGRTPAEASRGALAAVDRAATQWRRRLGTRATPPAEVAGHRLGDLLARAFPDRIGRQHPADPLRYLLANGRSARLFDDSALYGEPWLVATELRQQDGDSRVLRAAPVDEAALRRIFPAAFTEVDRVVWDPQRRGIAALRERRFDAIVLDSRPLPTPDRSRFAEALVDAVRQLGLDALPWTPASRQWRERVRCLAGWQPDAGWPDLSDAALAERLEDWLMPALQGLTRLDALAPEAFAEALKSPLDWSARTAVNRLAPTRVRVPSGLERAVHYACGEAPVLAVKVQELFGLADTPRILDGAVPLTLHLLSPAGRPLQVTTDLAGFWERTWPEVRREMKGRYPRHPWPEDPWSATATHRAKPRGT
ncbi:MAG: ATP-dependent helicase HrpB [Lysobacteraceae bacterium]